MIRAATPLQRQRCVDGAPEHEPGARWHRHRGRRSSSHVEETADVADRGQLLDRATQRWVRMTGRVVELDEATWLDGPIGRTADIAGSWLDDQARRLGGTVSSAAGHGLLPSMAALDGDG